MACLGRHPQFQYSVQDNTLNFITRSCMKHPVYNQNRLAQIMHTVQDRLVRNCILCLGQTRAKLYTLLRTARTKTIRCPAAHPRIGHIRENTPSGFQHTICMTSFNTLILFRRVILFGYNTQCRIAQRSAFMSDVGKTLTEPNENRL